jgi:selenocysteine lyase/cysteine desulfurase
VDHIEARCQALTLRLAQGLAQIEGLKLFGPWALQRAGLDPSAAMQLINQEPFELDANAVAGRSRPAPTGLGHLLSFSLYNRDGVPHDPIVVAQVLAEHYGITSRAGLHCAPTAHRHFGTYRIGTLRFSVGYFTSEADVDYAVDSVREVQAQL